MASFHTRWLTSLLSRSAVEPLGAASVLPSTVGTARPILITFKNCASAL